MGRVDVFQIEGLYLWFNSDDHLPPHFHAERKDEWEVRVRFLRAPSDMLEPVWAKTKAGVTAAYRKQLISLAERHRAALYAEWETKVKNKTPGARE